ncbi:MAG: LCP family protein [Eggerthellaceae bacterium]|nr:LCP family protein [Eggerthellaceae bacterium]
MLNSLAEHSRNSGRYTARKKHTGRNIAIVAVLLLALVLVGAGAATALYMNQLNNKISNQDEEQAEAIDAVLEPTNVPEGADVSDEPFYMMLIGSDTRHDEWGQRSDTNIVARVDPGNATITLISIPRDTAIYLDDYGMVKFNAAYNYYGTAGTIQAASDLLGVGISHYAEIDFEGLVNLIDSVGGVEVDVPMRIEDADAGDLVVEAGEQTLDGEHALIFARSRSYTTADFQRTTNQRLLVEAFVKKVMGLPATELPGVIQTAAGAVTTDLTVSEIIGYAMKFKNADEITMYSVLMPLTTEMIDGVDYVVCDTATLAEVMAVIDAGGDPSTVTSDFTITSSAEAEEKGESGIPVYVKTDDGNDDMTEGDYYADTYYDYYNYTYTDPNVYYDPGVYYDPTAYVDPGVGGDVYYDTGGGDVYYDTGGGEAVVDTGGGDAAGGY